MNILALDIGGSKFMVAQAIVIGTKIEFSHVVHRKLNTNCDQKTLVSLLEQAVEELGEFDYDRVGITIPGLADPKTGIWVYACFSGIRDFPIVDILSPKFRDRPIAIENDVNACALAEKKFGRCRSMNDFLWITVSNGVGGGLVLDGKIYPGHFGGAAEIGHFGIVDAVSGCQPPIRCGCGNFGCVEAEAAGPGIVKRYAWQLEKLQSESPEFKSPIKPPDTAKKIAELARYGDKAALSVFDTTGEILGKAASYAVNLMNLEAVIFGGGVSESFDLLLPSLEKSFRQRLFRNANPSVRLEKTELGYNAALAGAAAIALEPIQKEISR